MKTLRKKGSILLYTLFLTAFIVAFFASFRFQSKEMFGMGEIRSESFRAMMDLSDVLSGIRKSPGITLSAGDSEYMLSPNQYENTIPIVFARNSEIVSIPYTATGSKIYLEILEWAPVQAKLYASNASFFSGSVVTSTGTFSAFPSTQTGYLTIETLGGYSKISLESNGAKFTLPKTSYQPSRIIGNTRKPSPILHIVP